MSEPVRAVVAEAVWGRALTVQVAAAVWSAVEAAVSVTVPVVPPVALRPAGCSSARGGSSLTEERMTEGADAGRPRALRLATSALCGSGRPWRM